MEPKIGPKIAFFESKSGPCFPLLPLVFLIFFEIFQKKRSKRSKWPFYWVNNWPNPQHTWTTFWLKLGPILDSRNLMFLGHFWRFKICWNRYFCSVFWEELAFFKPTQLGTLFVNTTALTDFYPFLLQFCFWIFAVSGTFIFLGARNEQAAKHKLKAKHKKINNTTRCKQETHLVLLQKKKADNTDIKQYNFIV